MGDLRRTRRGQLGFSMVELMVALLILALALFAIMSMILHSAGTKEAQRELMRAKEASHQKLEELRSQPWTELSMIAPLSPVYGAFTVEGLSPPAPANKQGMGTVTVLATRPDPSSPATPSLIDVEVRIQWRSVRGDGNYSVRSLLTR